MKNLTVWLAALLRLLLPSPSCEGDGHAGRTFDLAQAPRRPDPYVMRLPDPRDARWRRWSARAQARMFGPDPLPILAEEWERWGDGGGRQGPHYPYNGPSNGWRPSGTHTTRHDRTSMC